MAEDHLGKGKRGLQRRKARKDGWTVARRRVFLDEFAATGNARWACARAGMTEGSAYQLRRRDPEFARQYDEVVEIAEARLESLLIEFAETKGRAIDLAAGAPPPVDMANFDPELALKVLSRRRPSRDKAMRRVGPRPQYASRDDLVSSIMRLIGAVERRRARQGQR